jgi:hypothetical protein
MYCVMRGRSHPLYHPRLRQGGSVGSNFLGRLECIAGVPRPKRVQPFVGAEAVGKHQWHQPQPSFFAKDVESSRRGWEGNLDGLSWFSLALSSLVLPRPVTK